MGRDTSLDEFATGGEGSTDRDGPPDDAADTHAATDPDDTTPTEAVTPAQSTGSYHPDGQPCDACGTPVARRWRDDDGLVCAACTSW